MAVISCVINIFSNSIHALNGVPARVQAALIKRGPKSRVKTGNQGSPRIFCTHAFSAPTRFDGIVSMLCVRIYKLKLQTEADGLLCVEWQDEARRRGR